MAKQKIIEEEEGQTFKSREEQEKVKKSRIVSKPIDIDKAIKKDPDNFFNSRPQGNQKNIDKLLEIYEYWEKYSRQVMYLEDDGEQLDHLFKIIDPNYTIADIESINQQLGKSKSVTFIDALIRNKINDKDIVCLDLRTQSMYSIQIGLWHEKGQVYVCGPSFASLGTKMKGGKITYYNTDGNQRGNIGRSMVGGTLTLHGNVELAGEKMNGGEMHIHGYPKTTGLNMNFGKIHVHNNCNDAGMNMKGGEIIVEQSAIDYFNRNAYIGKGMADGIIRIKGDTHIPIGDMMEGGHLIVEKSALKSVGRSMHNGLIEIKGNAKNLIAASMLAGEIYIHGNATGNIGWKSRGGLVRIDGTYKDIDNKADCEVYHKGNKIWP